MKYLNLFDTHSDYEASASTLEIPNVAYITATTEVIYNDIPAPEPPEYVTFDDPLVESKCATLYGDGTGCTMADLSAVTAMSASDWSGTNITSFDELEYFSGLTEIPVDGFKSCTGLTSVTLPNSLTTINQNAFQNCSGLTSVAIPNSVTSLWYGIFGNCTALESVNIPSGVNGIPEYLFYNCSSLSAITFVATTPPQYTYSSAFSGMPTTGNITVPQGSESNFYSLAQSLGANWTVNNLTPPAPPAGNYVLFEATALTAEQFSTEITLSGVTISGDTDQHIMLNYTNGYRFQKNGEFEIISTSGNITQIEFTQTGSSYPVTNLIFPDSTIGTYTTDNGVGTWVASSGVSTVSFNTQNTAQCRCSSVKVYLDNS